MGLFQTTRWSMVLAARAGDTDARAALERLCRAYRPPILAYIRTRGHSADAAEDLTQAFFARFVEARTHAAADPARGRFRTWLLTSLQNFLIDAHGAATAVKRGGGRAEEGLDTALAEELVDTQDASPEHAFDRAWALTLIDRALERVRSDAVRAGKGALFDRIREFLIETPDQAGYAAAAAELDMRPNTLAVTVHRLRARVRDALREELLETVSTPAELDEELRDLRDVLVGPA